VRQISFFHQKSESTDIFSKTKFLSPNKKNERAGSVVITYRRRVHQQSTVFSTEQEAIIKAIWLTKGTQRNKVIITDSLSTLTAINGNNHTENPETIKLSEVMQRLKKQITLLWIPGHMGIPGNEQTDEEAKEALDDDKQQNEEYPPKPQKISKNG
jgi:ribonuclease HI